MKTVILFMQSVQNSLLVLKRNTLTKRLLDQQRFFTERHFQMHLRKKKDVLQGQRGVRFPLIALTSQRSMGPSRHVLSQKVVGGTMVIHPPYQRSETTIQPTINNSRTHFWRKT